MTGFLLCLKRLSYHIYTDNIIYISSLLTKWLQLYGNCTMSTMKNTSLIQMLILHNLSIIYDEVSHLLFIIIKKYTVLNFK